MMRSIAHFVLVFVTLIFSATALAQRDTITIVLPEEPNTLDPCDTSLSAVGRVVRQNVTEPLTIISLDGGIAEPKLATSWQQVNPNTWVFELRDGVTFHDGTPLTGEAVAEAFNRALQPTLECHVLGHQFETNTYEARAIGDLSVQITTADPDPILPTRMSFIDIGAPNLPVNQKVREPVGTGPYRFVEWNAGQNIQLKRSDNYWGEAPVVVTAEYIWRTEPAVRAATVEAGEADIALNIAPQDADSELDIAYPDSETTFLRLDTQIPPLDDKRVRQAVAHALDREAMIGSVFDINVEAATQIILPSVNGYSPNVPLDAYDPELALQLLDEARADGVSVDDEIVLYGRLGIYPNSTESLEVIQAMLSAVGLNVRLEMTEVNAWLERLLKPFDEARPANIIQVMHDNNKGDAVFSVGTKFYSGGAESTLNDSRLDALLDQAAAAAGEERTALYQEAFEYMHDELQPVVPLFHMVGNVRVAGGIDFTPNVMTNSEIPLSRIAFE